MADTEVRQRKSEKETETENDTTIASEKPTNKSKGKKDAKVEYENPWLDVARVLTFLFVVSCGLSYLVSAGESFFWTMKVPPKYLRTEWWRSQLVRYQQIILPCHSVFNPWLTHFFFLSTQNGPLYLTPEQLRAYDGSDPEKPIYLAINHTIYDVSANRKTYGPGGSYNIFAGVDASRGFVTGCFREDQTPDMRGVEEMYLPLEDPEVDGQYWTKSELKILREQEKRQADKKVYDGLKHWVDFFGNSKKYTFVGYVKRPADWLEKEPRKTLCEQAAKGRKPRKVPEEKKKN